MTKHLEKKENKINKMLIAVIILAVLLVGTLTYIGIDKYIESKQEIIFQQGAEYGYNTAIENGNQTMLKEGAQMGYEQAILQIANLAVKCDKPVPLNIKNTTINMIAVDCLRQPQGEETTPLVQE